MTVYQAGPSSKPCHSLIPHPGRALGILGGGVLGGGLGKGSAALAAGREGARSTVWPSLLSPSPGCRSASPAEIALKRLRGSCGKRGGGREHPGCPGGLALPPAIGQLSTGSAQESPGLPRAPKEFGGWGGGGLPASSSCQSTMMVRRASPQARCSETWERTDDSCQV